jgi:hypothetical protein
MKDETREKLHTLKEKISHPFGHRAHGGKTFGKGDREIVHGDRRAGERADEIAGSEFLED